MNLNVLLDFQRRFLIRIEQQNSLQLASQNWGQLFTQYQDGFQVYEPFIANQSRCNEFVIKEWDKIKNATTSPLFRGMIASHTILTGFLLKPFQRLAKYPLLLDVGFLFLRPDDTMLTHNRNCVKGEITMKIKSVTSKTDPRPQSSCLIVRTPQSTNFNLTGSSTSLFILWTTGRVTRSNTSVDW